MSSSNLPSLVLDNCLKIDRIVYSELQMNRWLQTVRPTSEKLATTYRILLAYSHTVFQYAINDEELRKRRSFLVKILFRFPGVGLCLEPAVQSWEFRFWGA